ncbi:MAG: HAMP domain-containing protein [Deltaproteobacteria bacterium]|nr:HAMP domain-containing protein [Deltaproteobacteria bacterium]
MLKNAKLGTQLGFGFGTLLVLMAFLVATGLYGIRELQERLDDIVNDNLRKMVILQQMTDTVHTMSDITKDVSLSVDNKERQEQLIEKFKTAKKKYDVAFQKIEEGGTGDQGDVLREEENETLKRLQEAASTARSLNERAFDLVLDGQHNEAQVLFTKHAEPANTLWLATLGDLLSVQEKDNRLDTTASEETSRTGRSLLLSISVVTFVLALFIAFWLTRSLTRRLTLMVEFAGQVALGEFPAPLSTQSQDEVGQLSDSLNVLRSSFLSVMQQTQRIARGEYTIDITPRSEKDEMVIAFASMTDALRQTTAKNQQENWIRTGQTDLNDRLRGETDLIILAQNALTFLAEYVNAQVGALYLREEDESLHMVGSYAYTRRKNLSNVFRPGEGLVGQAALEKKPIVVTNVPDDYVMIASGVGESVPRSLVVIPLIDREVVEGVLELGSFHPLTEASLTLFSHVAGMLASVLNSARSRAQVETLLRTTQAQTEELQAQQEELQATNARLEEQTRSLQTSEAHLKEQQEELQQINEELEEKSELLTRQNVEVAQKHQEVEQARQALEEKAEQLALTSKYKSEFLANMSHELRTPLNSLQDLRVRAKNSILGQCLPRSSTSST